LGGWVGGGEGGGESCVSWWGEGEFELVFFLPLFDGWGGGGLGGVGRI